MSYRDYEHRRDDAAARRMALRRKIYRMEEERLEMLQAKSGTGPEISQTGDKHEQEADAVAKKVVSTDHINISADDITSSPTTIQSKEEDTPLMAKSEGGALHGTEQLQSQLDSTKGSGRALDDQTKSEMESKMNADLGDVRIHTDSKAHEMSEGINAKAFTHGQDVYFKNGNFDPGSKDGKELLAHELAHTQQQREGISRKTDPSNPDWVNSAIHYNEQQLRIESRNMYIRQLAVVSANDGLRDEAFLEEGIGKAFVYLVKSAQRILFPSKEGEDLGVYDAQHDGKLGPATWKAMMRHITASLYHRAEGMDLIDAAFYHHFIYKIPYNSTEVRAMLSLYQDYAPEIDSDIAPDWLIADVLAHMQLVSGVQVAEPGKMAPGVIETVLPAYEKKLAEWEAAKEERRKLIGDITTAKDAFSGMDQQRELEATIKPEVSMSGLPGEFKMPSPPVNLLDKAPAWLYVELRELVSSFNGLDVKDSEDRKLGLAAVGKFETQLLAYMSGSKDASGTENPVQKLTRETQVISSSGNISKEKAAVDKTEAEKMIRLVFNQELQARLAKEKTDDLLLEAGMKLRLNEAEAFSLTGYQYYSAYFAQMQEQELQRYGEELSTAYGSAMEKEFAERKQKITAKYQRDFEDYKRGLLFEYEPKMIEALETGDPGKDKYAVVIRSFQVSDPLNYKLTAEQEALEKEKSDKIEAKRKLLNEQSQRDMQFELAEISDKYNKLFTQSMQKHQEDTQLSIIVPKHMLEEAYVSYQRKIENNKKDESTYSSMLTDYKKLYALEEWTGLYKRLADMWAPSPSYRRPELEGLMMLDGEEYRYTPQKPQQQKPKTSIERSVEKLSYDEKMKRAEAEFYNYIFSREFVDKDGLPTITAMKAWAEEWKEIVQERLSYWRGTLEERSTWEILFLPMDFKNLNKNIIINRYELALENLEDTLDTPEYDKGFWDGFGAGLASLKLRHLIPFIGSIIEIGELYQVKQIADKYDEDKASLTPDELILLESYAMLQQMQQRNPSAYYSVGRGVGMAIPFIIEFVATLGAFSGAKLTAIRAGRWIVEKGIQKGLKTGVSQGTKNFIIRGTSTMIGSAVHTIVNPQIYFKEAVHTMIPQYIGVFGNEGLQLVDVTGENKVSFWNALWKAGVHSYFQFWTEQLGPFLIRQPKSVLSSVFKDIRFTDNVVVNWLIQKGVLPKNGLRLSKKSIIAKVLQYKNFKSLLHGVGIHGIPEEYLEEFMSARLTDLYDHGRFEINGQEELNTLITVAFISGPLQLAGGIKRVAEITEEAIDKVHLKVPRMQPDGSVKTQDFSFDKNLVAELEALAAGGALDIQAANAVIDKYYTSETKDKQEAALIHIHRSVLITYYVQQNEQVEKVEWALKESQGNYPLAFALLKASAGEALSPIDIAMLRTLPGFVPVAGVMEMMEALGTDPAVAKSIREKIAAYELDEATRKGLAEQMATGLLATGGQMTAADVSGEVELYDIKRSLPAELQDTFDKFRKQGQNAAGFKEVIEQATKDKTLEEFLLQLKTFNEVRNLRPDAKQAASMEEYRQQSEAYITALGGSELGADMANTERLALQAEMQLVVIDRIMSLFSEVAAKIDTDSKGSRSLQHHRENVLNVLLDPSLSVEAKKKRVLAQFRRLSRKMERQSVNTEQEYSKARELVEQLDEAGFGHSMVADKNGNVFRNDENVGTVADLEAQAAEMNEKLAFYNSAGKVQVVLGPEGKKGKREVRIVAEGLSLNNEGILEANKVEDNTGPLVTYLDLGDGLTVTIRQLDATGSTGIKIDAGKLGKQGAEELADILAHLSSADKDTRKNAMRDLRKGPRKGIGNIRHTELEGAVFTPYLQAQIQAIETLQSRLASLSEKEQIDLVLAFDRGGTLIADQLNVSQLFPGKAVYIDKPENDHQDHQNEKFLEYVRTLMRESGSNSEVTVAFVESFISGSSTRGTLRGPVQSLLSTYPNLKIKLILLQQELHTSDVESIDDFLKTKYSVFGDQGRLSAEYVRIPFLIGEDVDYQAEPDHKNAKKPIILFDQAKGIINAYSITPEGKATARDIIVALTQGKFKGKIGNLH